jgi:hypothetical protein
MRQLILALGLMAGAAHAQDEYYAITDKALMTAAPTNDPGWTDPSPLTVTGWFETNGYGKSGCVVSPCEGQGFPGYNPLIIGYDVNITYHGVTEIMQANQTPGPISGTLIATKGGLYCDKCNFSNEGYPFFQFWGAAGKGGNGFYQYIEPGYAHGQLNFATTALLNDFFVLGSPAPYSSVVRAAVPRATAAPELDPGHACAALLLLAGVGLVLKGRR